MSKMLFFPIFIALLTIIVFGFYACNSSSVSLSSLDLTDLEGNKIDLNDYKGKPIILNFWATWCPPCRKEKPHLEKARQILEKEGFVFLSISQEPLDLLKKYQAQHPYQLTYLHSKTNIKLHGIFNIPHTFVLNKKGKVALSHNGFKDWDSAENIALLKELAK